MSNNRRVFLMTNAGPTEIPFMQLKKGDLFSMLEPDGKPVTYNGSLQLEALSDPFIASDNVPSIVMQNYNPEVLH